MNLGEYRDSIKQIIDSTDNELLLKHWKKQLEWDIKNEKEFTLTDEEMYLVEEGLKDYEEGNIISLEEFVNSRKK